MDKKEGTHLGKTFVSIFIVSAIVVGGLYYLAGFEIALLGALCWLVSVMVTAIVGVENTINQK